MGAGAAGTPEGRARQAEGAARAGALRRECGSEEIVRGGGSLTPPPLPPPRSAPPPSAQVRTLIPSLRRTVGSSERWGRKKTSFGGHRAGLGCSLPTLASLSPCTSQDPASSPAERRRPAYPPPRAPATQKQTLPPDDSDSRVIKPWACAWLRSERFRAILTHLIRTHNERGRPESQQFSQKLSGMEPGLEPKERTAEPPPGYKGGFACSLHAPFPHPPSEPI